MAHAIQAKYVASRSRPNYANPDVSLFQYFDKDSHGFEAFCGQDLLSGLLADWLVLQSPDRVRDQDHHHQYRRGPADHHRPACVNAVRTVGFAGAGLAAARYVQLVSQQPVPVFRHPNVSQRSCRMPRGADGARLQ